jgi:alpha-1,3-rhamnosyl/mannosyltransferase
VNPPGPSGSPGTGPASHPGNPAAVGVGVNLLWVVPGVVGGSEEYVVGMLAALARRPASDRPPLVAPQLFVTRDFQSAHPELCSAFPTVTAPGSAGSKAVRVGLENTWLAWQLRRRHLGVVHHFGGLVPFVPTPGVRRVVTIHDLQPLDFPQNFGMVKRTFQRIALPWTLRHADAITTLSGFTRDAILARWSLPDTPIVVLPPGTRGPQGTTTPRTPPPASDAAVLARWGVAGAPYFLYPAITYPHKDHPVVVAALAQLGATHPEARLVLTGGPGPAEDVLRDAISASGVGERVVRTGRLPGDDLAALYRGATAMVFPSHYEGFGLPVLEAMRHGCAVIAADATALPEVVGNAGILATPGNPASFADAMRRVLDDPGLRSSLVAAGHIHAARFTWEGSVDALTALWGAMARPAGRGEATT